MMNIIQFTETCIPDYKKEIDSYRFHKMARYKERKHGIIDSFIQKFEISTPKDTLIKWYNLFNEYSTLGYLDEDHYWKCMRRLHNKFSMFHTPIHTIVFNMYYTEKNKVGIYEYMMSLLVFNEKNDYFRKLRYKVTRDLLERICIHNITENIYVSFTIHNKLIDSEYMKYVYENRYTNEEEYINVFGSFIYLNKLFGTD